MTYEEYKIPVDIIDVPDSLLDVPPVYKVEEGELSAAAKEFDDKIEQGIADYAPQSKNSDLNQAFIDVMEKEG